MKGHPEDQGRRQEFLLQPQVILELVGEPAP